MAHPFRPLASPHGRPQSGDLPSGRGRRAAKSHKTQNRAKHAWALNRAMYIFAVNIIDPRCGFGSIGARPDYFARSKFIVATETICADIACDFSSIWLLGGVIPPHGGDIRGYVRYRSDFFDCEPRIQESRGIPDNLDPPATEPPAAQPAVPTPCNPWPDTLKNHIA